MAKLWNITTDKRVYVFTDDNELNAFVKFWQCEIAERELVAYIGDSNDESSVLKLAQLNHRRQVNQCASAAVEQSYAAARVCASDFIYL